jgi:pimeloyl-ACP methyl ester carboxylesterase
MARGSFVNGKQMYVESFIPAQVRHPYPIVLVHGGGGQGLDWMGTPDGRRGWTQILLEEGYKVYVVDRPGHGRSPFHPDVDGPFPPQNLPLEQMSGQFTPPNASRPANNELRKLHNQWPGTGEVGSRDLDQLVASQGGSYVQAGGFGAPAAGAGGRGAGRGAGQGAGAGGPAGAAPARGGAPAVAAAPPVLGASGMPAGGPDSQHMVWRQRGAMLLDKIGPSIIMTHSAGGPFGWLVAEIRPNLVKGIVAIEGGGQPFGGANAWGMSTIPVAIRSAGVRSVGNQIEAGRVARAWCQRVSAAGGARAEAQKSAEHPDRHRHRRSVICFAWKSRRRRVLQAGGLQGRGDAARHAGNPRQRPHDDGREEQP